jgi:hypothetical protein
MNNNEIPPKEIPAALLDAYTMGGYKSYAEDEIAFEAKRAFVPECSYGPGYRGIQRTQNIWEDTVAETSTRMGNFRCFLETENGTA